MSKTKLRLRYLTDEDRKAIRDPHYHSWICELGCYHRHNDECDCVCHGSKKLRKLIMRRDELERQILELQTTTQGKCQPKENCR